jgi:tryptophanase
LTSGELKVDSEDKIIPFSIFISTYRRKKILAAMMGKTMKEKEEGTRILNNYKKQLAEKMAREKAEKGRVLIILVTLPRRVYHLRLEESLIREVIRVKNHQRNIHNLNLRA